MLRRTDHTLLSSSDVGYVNRARIMRLLYSHGVLARADLATRLGVSRATIGAIVQPLLDDHVLVEQPPRPVGGSGGKPPRPLWFGTERTVGAVYLSADQCIVAAVRMDGVIVAVDESVVADVDPEILVDQLLDSCKRVLDGHRLVGVGVAFAGTVDTATRGLIANYRRPAVGLVPVTHRLGDALRVPVFVDHHPRIQAFGDAWFGLGRDLDSFASVVTGEVLGVGIVQGGQVVRGVRGAGGEAGHMVVDINGRQCLCGRRGCWETVATLGWLREEAGVLGLPFAGEMSSERLVAGAGDGPGDHRDLLDRYAAAVALGLANMEQLLGVGTYILHGDAVGGGATMLDLLQRQLIQNSPQRQPTPRVLLAYQPDHSTLLGATGLVLSGLYRDRV